MIRLIIPKLVAHSSSPHLIVTFFFSFRTGIEVSSLSYPLKPDISNYVAELNIPKKERKKLTRMIPFAFGSKQLHIVLSPLLVKKMC